MQDKITVVYYEDNSSLREGISFLIQSAPGLELLATFSNCDTVKTDMEEMKPDVVLMDIDLPGINGIEAAGIVKTVSPKTQVMMLTVFDNEEKIFQAIRNGASGYLLKNTSPNEIIDSIFDVYRGGSPMTANVARKVLQYFQHQPKTQKVDYNLSDREQEILKGLVSGYSYKLIANEYFISIDTVRSHIRHIYEKLHVNSKTEAVLKAINEGLV
ncbi:MAG: response regulator transcription factor [Chitinophagaceae bacterium]